MAGWSWMSRLPRSDRTFLPLIYCTLFHYLRLTEVGSSVQSMASYAQGKGKAGLSFDRCQRVQKIRFV